MPTNPQEDEEVKKEDELIEEFDMCPMGCGRTTDDPYGGPCTACWDRIDELEKIEIQEGEF